MQTPSVHLEAPEFAGPGERIDFSVVIGNPEDEPREIHLLGREIVFDLSVVGDGGRIVWRRLEGETTQSILRIVDLAPGESITLNGSWDQRDSNGDPVKPGFYTLQASLPTDTAPLVSQDALLHILDS